LDKVQQFATPNHDAVAQHQRRAAVNMRGRTPRSEQMREASGMRNRLLVAVLLVLLVGLTCFAQSTYKGLTPGRSTRADVERVLGRPVKELSETLIEYRAQPLTGKIYVQYRKDSSVVERIEMLCRLETSTCEDLIKSLNMNLPENPDSENIDDQKWKSLYGSPLFIATSGVMADVTSKSTPASRLGFYSRELYESDFEEVREANEATLVKNGSTAVSRGVLNGKAIENPEPAYPTIARMGHVSGTVAVRVTVDEQGRIITGEVKAVSGHPLLREAAVAAAKHARLAPTLLSGKPVRVTGTLIYNFNPE
jgi:TonB family protein